MEAPSHGRGRTPVAAPEFPASARDLPGDPSRDDLEGQAADMSAVITALLDGRAGPIDPHRIAVAGHSDGGTTVAEMLLNPRDADPRVAAYLVLSGATPTGVDGTNRANLARLNANGTLDLSFNTSSGPNNTVRAIAIQADGKILIGGDFTDVNGQPRTRLARLAPDGTLDATFAPVVNGPVYSIALQVDGKIVVGGAFQTISGSTRRYVARLTASGSVDSQFDTGAGPNNPVNSVAVDDSGKIVLGGLFTSISGSSRSYVGRLNGNGSIDRSFDPGPGANANVNSVATTQGNTPASELAH